NNIQRIVVEALAVTLARDARARALQLPAWNEAMGLPRPWDQQWSLRIQQVLAFETDMLEYPDIFEGSVVMEGLVEEFMDGARDEMAVVAEKGGAVEAVPYMKARLVESHRERFARIENGEQTVVGLNRYTETEESPLTASVDGGIMKPDPKVEKERVDALEAWRSERDQATVDEALAEVARVAGTDENIMPSTIAAARAGATTGEWAATLRDVFGAYRGPTGVGGASPAGDRESLTEVRARVNEVSEQIGHRVRVLVGKPGLDGHSNGSEQIALRARDVGMEVVYQGIRLTPEQIVESAVQEDVDLIGLSILSGSHLELIPEVVRLLKEEGVEVPVVAGGIIPPEDAASLKAAGVAGVFTPKDFDMNEIMGEFVNLVAASHEDSAVTTA
ncbi:MAG: ethylmalonyl-CoA mutase, partial [Actinomycetota bacterium]|nr:ethylmalonyl-CoA mutase [Actinomycetota bacterium]